MREVKRRREVCEWEGWVTVYVCETMRSSSMLRLMHRAVLIHRDLFAVLGIHFKLNLRLFTNSQSLSSRHNRRTKSHFDGVWHPFTSSGLESRRSLRLRSLYSRLGNDWCGLDEGCKQLWNIRGLCYGDMVRGRLPRTYDSREGDMSWWIMTYYTGVG